MKDRNSKIKNKGTHKTKQREQERTAASGWAAARFRKRDDLSSHDSLSNGFDADDLLSATTDLTGSIEPFDADEPQRSKTFLEKFFSKLGFGVLLLVLFLLALSPAVFGYIWFGDRNIWSIRYLQLMEAHPFYFQRTLLVAAVFALVYATAMAWLVLKIKKFRKHIFLVLFVGAFSFSIVVCNWLLEQQIITYWSW